MDENKKEPLITRKNYQKTETKNKKPSRLNEKEQGRRLNTFYNWAITIVAIAIVLVFVLAFVI